MGFLFDDLPGFVCPRGHDPWIPEISLSRLFDDVADYMRKEQNMGLKSLPVLELSLFLCKPQTNS